MSLMTSSTSKMILKKKYSNFIAPTVRVIVNDIDLGEKLHTGVDNINVDLTSEYSASGCSFDILGEYRPEQSDFNSKGAYKHLQIGASVEIKLGYIITETVFVGLITEVNYIFDSDDGPYIHIECMDAKCLLMKTQRLEIRSEKKISQIVNKVLSESPVSSYLKGKKVSINSVDQEPLQVNMESDYDFLVSQAQYFGCEFFIFAGQAYFRDGSKSATPIMTLTPDLGILSASFSLRGAPLVKKVTVVGIDPESDKKITGTVAAKGKFGTGSTPNKMLSNTDRVYFDQRAKTETDVKNRAKVLMSGIQSQFGVLECSCIGLPEYVPGRKIKVKGLMSVADKSFYITRVVHKFNTEAGYTTSFEARISNI